MEEKLDKKLDEKLDKKLDEKLIPIRAEIADVRTTLTDEISGIKITLENDVLPRLKEITSCYQSTYERYRDGACDIEKLKDDMTGMKNIISTQGKEITMLEHTVSQHSAKLKTIS